MTSKLMTIIITLLLLAGCAQPDTPGEWSDTGTLTSVYIREFEQGGVMYGEYMATMRTGIITRSYTLHRRHYSALADAYDHGSTSCTIGGVDNQHGRIVTWLQCR